MLGDWPRRRALRRGVSGDPAAASAVRGAGSAGLPGEVGPAASAVRGAGSGAQQEAEAAAEAAEATGVIPWG